MVTGTLKTVPGDHEVLNQGRELDQEKNQRNDIIIHPSLLSYPYSVETNAFHTGGALHPFIDSLLRSPIPFDGRLCISNLNKNVIGASVVSIDIIEQAFLLATNQISRNALFLSSDVGPETVHELHIEGYSFSRLPEGIIGSIYTRIRYVTITDNPGLDCIGSIVRQFPNLEGLFIRKCGISTLDPLREMKDNNLKEIACPNCLLSENGTDWDGVMRTLGSSKGPLRCIDFSSNRFTKFPKSINLVGRTLERLHIAHNSNLEFLPEEVGRFPELSLLDLRGDYDLCDAAKKIETITDGACELVHPYKGHGSAYWDLLHYWRGLINLSILFKKSRSRLNARKQLLLSIPSTPSQPETQVLPPFPAPSPVSTTTNDNLKVVFLGGRNVGKSTIVRRLSASPCGGEGTEEWNEGSVAASQRKKTTRSIDVDVRTCRFLSQAKDDEAQSRMHTKFNLWDFQQSGVNEDVECGNDQCDDQVSCLRRFDNSKIFLLMTFCVFVLPILLHLYTLQAPQSLFFSPNTLYVIVWDMGVHNLKIPTSCDDYFGCDSSDDDNSCDDFSRMIASQNTDQELVQEIDDNVLYWLDSIIQSGVKNCAVLPVASFDDAFAGAQGLGTAEAQRRCDVLKKQMISYYNSKIYASTKPLPSLQFCGEDNAGDGDSVLRLCSKKMEGISKLKAAILNVTTRCPIFSEHLKEKIPSLTLKVWDAIRALKEDHKKIVSVEDIKSMIGQHDGHTVETTELCNSLSFLSSIGEVVFLGRPNRASCIADIGTADCYVLSKFVILCPKWLTCIISCVLKRDFWLRLGEDWRFGCSLSELWSASSDIAAVSSEELSLFWESINSVKKMLSKTSAAKLCAFLNQALIRCGVLVPVSRSAPHHDSFDECTGMLSSTMGHRSLTMNSALKVEKQSSICFLLPSLFAQSVPRDAWSYKSKKWWKQILAHSWLFPGTSPPAGFMGWLTAAVMYDLFMRPQLCSENPPIRVHHCFCWKSSFVLKLGMEVVCEHSGEKKESIVDIFVCLTSRDSVFSIASGPSNDSRRKLIVSAKGQSGDGSKRIWEGGFALVIESVERVIRSFDSANWRKSLERAVICPECLARYHCSKACFWGKEKLLESAAKGAKQAYCSRGHSCCLSVLCGIRRPGVPARTFSGENHSSSIATKVLPAVVIVGLWDEKKQQIIEAGSGFVADKKHGLVITAAHVLISMHPGKDFGKEKVGKAVIGFIPKSRRTGSVDATKADFWYFAEVVAKDVSNVDACVLRITAKVHNKIEDERLRQLGLTSRCEPNESILLLGYNQRMKGPQYQSGPNQHLDCSRGYVKMSPRRNEVRREAADVHSYIPRTEMIVCGCRVYGGHSGSPCINQDEKVIGILSEADPADPRQCHIVPAIELKRLLSQGKEVVQSMNENC